MAERTLTFGHEGVLFRNSFIMYDHETDTLWIHTTGEAIRGPLRGEVLPFLPSTITTWGAWRDLHPDTTVLIGPRADGRMGSFGGAPPSAYGLSLGSGRTAKLYPYDVLRAANVVNDSFESTDVVVVFDPDSQTALAFDREVGSRRLQFAALDERDASSLLMRDTRTRSIWRRSDGRCIRGQLEGEQLRQVPATPWLTERWRGFYPGGELYRLPRARSYR